MTLREIGEEYRRQSERLRERIRQVASLPPGGREEEILRAERLRLLEAMRRDTAQLAVVCLRYYDRSYRPNERCVL